MKKYITALIGIILLLTGVCVLKVMDDPTRFFLTLAYLCIGFSCGFLAYAIGEISVEKSMKSDPTLQKKMEIEKNDERNITITNCAKAKGYDAMNFVFVALITAFALMNTEIFYVLLLVGAYLFVHGYEIYYRLKYEKEM